MALDTLGQIHQARGRADQALSCFEQSWAARRLAGDQHGEAVALQHLGGARRSVGDLSGAQEAWWQALEIYDALNSPAAAEVRAALAVNWPGRPGAARWSVLIRPAAR
jgi:tetratricopeptide (TPR) repeat protein